MSRRYHASPSPAGRAALFGSRHTVSLQANQRGVRIGHAGRVWDAHRVACHHDASEQHRGTSMTSITSHPSSARPVAPGSEAPALECELLDGSHFRLADRCPENFTMIVFYRGNHCPVCRVQLRDLDRRLDDFASRGRHCRQQR